MREMWILRPLPIYSSLFPPKVAYKIGYSFKFEWLYKEVKLTLEQATKS